jgi:hypothetical protein
MVPSISEPVLAGIIVSLINKFVLNNFSLFNCCKNTFYEEIDYTDLSECEDHASNITAVNDAIHSHYH